MIKKLFTCILFSCVLCLQVYPQESTPKEKKLTVNEQTQQEKAQYFVEQKNYRLAMPIFENLLAKHPSDNSLKFFTAICYASRPDKHPLMLQYLNEVYAVNKKADKIEYELALANFYNYKFDEASNYLSQYKAKLKKNNPAGEKEVEQLNNSIKNAKSLTASPINVRITNAGNIINTTASECSPYIANDSLLIYTYRGELSMGGLQNMY
ncbi:MAG TPA: hypothetical protein VKG26_00500, partial [Bacteroidia bacterium]|nr:hypothetical protein [Bacteroidia bacterium]